MPVAHQVSRQDTVDEVDLTADPLEDDEAADEDEFDPFAGQQEDPPPGNEGDDRVHEGARAILTLPPLPRILRLGSKGRDVRALQRALQAAGFRQEPPTPKPSTFDDATDAEVRAFQRAKDLLVDGEVGTDTYGALAQHYDTFGLKLLNAVGEAEPDTLRRKIAAAAHCGFVNRDEVHYTQEAGTRMDGILNERRPPDFPRSADCSSFAIWCYWAAGAPDPNESGYSGGWSGSLLQRGRETNEPGVGDIAFYGTSRSDINHVTVCVGNGRCVSHGQESGPTLLPLDYERGSSGGLQLIRTYLS
jgi:Putative peptidoglycan binding domain/NlpC/P60 family